MPTVQVKSTLLFESLEKKYTEKEFDELCFEYGIELDDVTNEDGEDIYHIDIPANRYDLLCLEGLSSALRVFLKKDSCPKYKTILPSNSVKEMTRMVVREETSQIRPFVVCAILRGLNMDQNSYNSCIELQDQLHRNLCRRRTLVAIGTHDLDNIKGPFTYEALPPKDIKFQHLFADREMEGKEMMDWFRTDPLGKNIKEYTDIIYDSPVYPVIYDSNRTVLSLPPIINGCTSKIGPNTKNMFIECTATDLTKAKIVLNTVVAMFAKYCDNKDSVEQVEVVYDKPVIPGGQTEAVSKMVTPNLDVWTSTARVDQINSVIGINLKPEEMPALADRMLLGPASLSDDKKTLNVTVPVTRSDIMHEIDVIEDIAIAYGYNNIVRTVPASYDKGKELSVNLISDLLRFEIARQGYIEALSFGLHSKEDNFEKINKKPDNSAVVIANPKNVEFEVVRTSLIPGVLKTLRENLNQKFSGDGLKLFEVSDVVLRDPLTPEEKDIGARQERRLVALHAGTQSAFEVIHGLVDRLMEVLSVVPADAYCPEGYNSAHSQILLKNGQCIGEYKILPFEEDFFFPQRGASIVWKKSGSNEYKQIGKLGVVHPSVLSNFEIPFPTTVVELNIEPFVRY